MMRDDPDRPYMAANGHQYTWRTRYSEHCLDTCPCHGDPEYPTAESYAGERLDHQ